MTSDPTEYPASWRPKGAPPPDGIEPPEVEVWLQSLTDDEYTALTHRVRGDR